MKEQILELRRQGKSYKQICEKLGCSKGTVSYHCGQDQKSKTIERQRSRRKDLVITKKVENFQYDRRVKDKAEDFQRTVRGSKLKERTLTFSWRDVIEKFGWETECYLTGKKIDLKKPRTYHFDHIDPRSKGGSKEIDNLGICCCEANRAKSDMTVEQLLDLCQEILEHHGCEVNGREPDIG